MYSLRRSVISISVIAILGSSAIADPICTAKAPVGTNDPICGVKGTVNKNSYYPDLPYYVSSPSEVSSLEQCAYLCSRRAYNKPHDTETGNNFCRSYSYDLINGICQYGVYEAEKILTEDESSNVAFYDQSCFTCGGYCEQPEHVNLFDNGDFEAPLLGPWAVSGSSSIGPGYNSNSSFQGVGSGEISQTFNKCQFLYKVSFDLRITPGVINKTKMSLYFGDFESIWTMPTGTSGIWVPVSAYFHNSNGQLSWIFGVSKGDTYNLDNVVVTRAPSHPPTAPPTQRGFINGGFESGALHPWKLQVLSPYSNPRQFASIVSPGLKDTEYAFNMTTGGVPDFYLRQNITTMPDTGYLVSFDYAMPDKNYTYYPSVSIIYGSPDGDIISNGGSLALPPGEGHITHPITALGNRTLIQLKFISEDNYDYIMLDNFRLHRIIEQQ